MLASEIGKEDVVVPVSIDCVVVVMKVDEDKVDELLHVTIDAITVSTSWMDDSEVVLILLVVYVTTSYSESGDGDIVAPTSVGRVGYRSLRREHPDPVQPLPFHWKLLAKRDEAVEEMEAYCLGDSLKGNIEESVNKLANSCREGKREKVRCEYIFNNIGHACDLRFRLKRLIMVSSE